MTGSAPRHRLAADAVATFAVVALGLLLLWCGMRLLPVATQTGSVVSAAGSPAVLSAAALTHAAGFCAAAAGLLLTLWWIAGTVCVVAGYLLHRFGFRRAGTRAMALAPGPLRRLASAALGLSLAVGSTVGTAAGAAPSIPRVAAATSAAAAGIPAAAVQAHGQGTANDDGPPAPEPVSPLWRPVPPLPTGGSLLTGSPRSDEREVVVAAGDTLWSLAAAQLGTQATDAETAALWPRWYAANRDIIGPDPALIYPGQVLTVPPP